MKTRVTSVENGRKYQTGGGAEVAMPDGASIFETTGAWEDFATPSRDLRLLDRDRRGARVSRSRRAAARAVRDAGGQERRRREGRIGEPARVGACRRASSPIRAATAPRGRSRSKTWSTASAALEMAYNVNDCVELRWGAPDNSDEASTCKRRAPGAQRGKMTEYRAWFQRAAPAPARLVSTTDAARLVQARPLCC